VSAYHDGPCEYDGSYGLLPRALTAEDFCTRCLDEIVKVVGPQGRPESAFVAYAILACAPSKAEGR
jgi:hypothetical protein